MATNPPDAATDLDAAVRHEMRRRSRRGFLTLGLGAAVAAAGWSWLKTRADDGGTPYPLRRMLEVNEKVAERYFSPARLAPTFPRERAREPRPNGDEGLTSDFDPAQWQLIVNGAAAGESRPLSLADITRLPRIEMTTELKCIEGWSTIVTWAGARFSELAATIHAPATRYVALETPDGAYYVGLDMASAMHPQTLLCYEMNGAPLTLDHGAPLRLVTTVKYGIKLIKRIGTITFTNERPRDFWAERGYDWYAGH